MGEEAKLTFIFASMPLWLSPSAREVQDGEATISSDDVKTLLEVPTGGFASTEVCLLLIFGPRDLRLGQANFRNRLFRAAW